MMTNKNEKPSWKQHFKTTPYVRGSKFEYRVRDHFRKLGYFAAKQAKSAFPDLFVMKAYYLPNTRGTFSEVLLVECRVGGYISLKEKVELLKIAKQVGGKAMLASREKNRKIKLEDLNVKNS